MQNDRHEPNRPGWTIVSAVVLVSAVLGLLDVPNRPWAGFTAGADNTVTQVTAESPAESAGLEVGDVVAVSGGVPVSDYAARLRQPRPAIGESRRFVVTRGGEQLELELTYAEAPPTNKLLAFGATAIGLAFLVCGVGAYLKRPGTVTRLLAFAGLAAMVGFAGPPYVSNLALRLLTYVLPFAGLVAVPALLVHFLLCFPEARRRSWATYALTYGPPTLVVLFGILTLFAQPRLLPALNVAAPAVVVVQILVALGILVRRFFKADPETRSAHGLSVLLVGFVVGLVPIIAAGFAPSLPGASFYFLTTVLIPLSLAWAALKPAEETPPTLVPTYS